jgi:hypothetical protein
MVSIYSQRLEPNKSDQSENPVLEHSRRSRLPIDSVGTSQNIDKVNNVSCHFLPPLPPGLHARAVGDLAAFLPGLHMRAAG